MAERVKILCEGPQDDAFVRTLAELERLPLAAELAEKRPRAPRGQDQVVVDVRAHLAARAAVVALIDYDELRGIEVASWMAERLGIQTSPRPLGATGDAFVITDALGASATVIGVGHLALPPTDVALLEGGSVDEYLLRMLLDRDTYGATSQVKECPYDVWRNKILETRAMVVRNGLPAPTIKQLIRLPHLLTSFQGAPTTLMERVMHGARAASRLDELTDPLRSTLVRAIEDLAAPPGR